MQIPARMLGVATTIFWVFLIIFFASAAFSVKDLQFDFGETIMYVNADNNLVFSMPITITNRGLYDLSYFNVTTRISSADDFVVARGSTLIRVIGRNERVNATHNMTIVLSDLFENHSNLLFNDTELRIYEAVGMRLAEVIPVQASVNVSMPWGAPFHNFTLGNIEYAAFNETHVRAVVPISFENHSFLSLAGTIQMRICNETHVLANSQTSIDVPENSQYSGNVEFYVPIVGMTESGRFEAYFETPFFSYGPLVIPYG